MEGTGAKSPRTRRLGAYGRMRTAVRLRRREPPLARVDNFFLWIARNPLNLNSAVSGF